MSSQEDSSQPTRSRRARIGWTVPLGRPATLPICEPYHSAPKSLIRTPRTNRVAMVMRGAIVVLYLGVDETTRPLRRPYRQRSARPRRLRGRGQETVGRSRLGASVRDSVII